MSTLNKIAGFSGLWANAQHPMQDVLRWGNFPDYGQTLLMHNSSLPLVVRYVSRSCAGRQVDELLLIDCALVHDHGEPLTGGDEHADNKTEGKEGREINAFWKLIENMPEKDRYPHQRAFALQYCRKKVDDQLSQSQLEIVRGLRQSYALEALLFEFSERFDYVLSALAGHTRGVRNEKENMLQHTFGNQAAKLDTLVLEHSPLAKIWSECLRREIECLAT